MNLAKICVNHPVLTVMLNLVFIFFGIVSFSRLTMDLFPEVDGKSPEYIEIYTQTYQRGHRDRQMTLAVMGSGGVVSDTLP